MRNTKKLLALLLVLVLSVGVFAACGDGDSADGSTADGGETTTGDTDSSTGDGDDGSSSSGGTTYINIGTGGTSGTYYPLGGAMAEIWQNNVDGVIATAEATGASVANVNMLADGELEVVIIQNDVAYYAQEGIELFEEEGAAPTLRGMASLYSEPLQCITTDESIKSIGDLAGKRVAVGAIGSGVYVNVTQILDAAGLDFDDLGEVQYLSFAEAANSLRDRQIDAAFIVAGVPTAAVVDLGTQRDVYLVPIDGAVADNLKSTYSFYTDYVIPAGTYSNQDEDVMTLTVKSMLAVSSTVSDDLVYQMLQTMYDNQNRIEAAHAVGADIKIETGLEGMSIEMHPGAASFFADNGVS